MAGLVPGSMDNSRVTGKSERHACVKCGTPYAITYQTVKTRGRERDLPFCLACWRRLQVAVRIVLLASVFEGVLLAGGFVLARATGQYLPLAIAAALGTSGLVAALLYLRSARPASA